MYTEFTSTSRKANKCDWIYLLCTVSSPLKPNWTSTHYHTEIS